MNAFELAWNDPHSRHAILVHWPIVLGLLGPALVVAMMVAGRRARVVSVLALLVFMGASIGAKMAISAGYASGEDVVASGVSDAENAAVEQHEKLAAGGWKWPLIPLALCAAATIPGVSRFRAARLGLLTLALAGAAAVTVWVTLTAQAGGELVYRYGLGVPERGKLDSGVPKE